MIKKVYGTISMMEHGETNLHGAISAVGVDVKDCRMTSHILHDII